jgi:lipopolysaccharide transport protein LptA
MKSILFALLLYLAMPSWAQQDTGPFPVTADAVRSNQDTGATTYEGNARAEIAGLVIEADRIIIFGDASLPSRIEASGNPLEFRQQGSAGDLSGTAHEAVLSVSELKLTLIDYVIADPDGNSMKGRKATFVLEP